MKLRNLFIALTLLLSATTISAQTMTTTAIASKARAARSVANDLRNKKVKKATATVLQDKDVQRHVKVDKTLQDKATNTNVRSEVAKAKKDPVGYGSKSARELKKHKKSGPKWLHRKAKKRHSSRK
jgi:ribosomal protein L22